jgi:hypothetical protein
MSHHEEIEAVREVVKNANILADTNTCAADMKLCMTRFQTYERDHICYRSADHSGPHCCNCGRCSESS